MTSENENDDLLLACRDCNADFVITSSQRKWFIERSLTVPKRCPACRLARRQEREAGNLWPAERIDR
jgi:ribosomal protein L36